MISDIPKKVAQMRELIAVIDRPVDQVLIESRIVIATDSFARDLGARFGVQGRRIGNNTRVISGGLENNTTIIEDNEYEIPGGLNFNLPATTSTGLSPGAIAYTLLGANFAIDLNCRPCSRKAAARCCPTRAWSPPTSARRSSARVARSAT